MLKEKVVLIALKRVHVVPVAGAEVVDADDKVAFGQEFVGQVKAKEPGAPCEQSNFARGGSGAHGRRGFDCNAVRKTAVEVGSSAGMSRAAAAAAAAAEKAAVHP